MRKATKAESAFPTDDSLLKMLYVAMVDITKSGLVSSRIGASYTLNWRCISLTICRADQYQTIKGGG
jgi:transposase-like protein